MTESMASFTLVEEGSALPRGAVAEIRDDRVVVERLRTPRRYYLLVLVLAAVGVSYGAVSIWVGVAGFVVGAASGFVVSVYLGNRRKEAVLRSVQKGDRELSPDVVLKRNKIDGVETGGDDASGAVKVSTSDGELELRGSEDDLEAAYEALV